MMNSNSNLYKFGFGSRNEHGDEYMAYKVGGKIYQKKAIGGAVSNLATFLFGDATTKVNNFLKEHGEEEIRSVEMGRVPIEAAISTAMELISKGEYGRQIQKKGYDAFFHLFIIINGTYRIEKNQNVNVITDYSQKENEDRISLGSSKNTINQFFKNAIDAMGKDDFWRNYDGLRNNCQWWAENTVAANGLNRQEAREFAFQDTQELRDAIDEDVQDLAKEGSGLLSGIDKFLSWISGGSWGFKRGGMVGKSYKSRKVGAMR